MTDVLQGASRALVARLMAAALLAVSAGAGAAAFADPPTDRIADGARLKISYDGQAHGVLPPSRPGIRDIQVDATYHVEVTYDGETIKGLEIQKSTFGPLNGANTFSGTRHGDSCEVTTERGSKLTARCTMQEFSYTQTVPVKYGQAVYHFAAAKVSVVDLVEQERQRRIAQEEQDRQQAEAARKAAEYQAFLKSRPPATDAQRAALSRAIAQDSQAWLVNRYDDGSLAHVIAMPPAADGADIVRGDYTFNNGAQGWVQGRMRKGAVECLEYWDFQGACGAVRGSAAAAAPKAVAAEKHSGYPDWLDYKPLADDPANGACISWAAENRGSSETSKTVGVDNGFGGKTPEYHSTMTSRSAMFYKNICNHPFHFQKSFGFLDGIDRNLEPGDVIERDCASSTSYTGHFSDAFAQPTSSCAVGRYFSYKDWKK